MPALARHYDSVALPARLDTPELIDADALEEVLRERSGSPHVRELQHRLLLEYLETPAIPVRRPDMGPGTRIAIMVGLATLCWALLGAAAAGLLYAFGAFA